METIKVNMSPNPLDVQTIHASQNDGEARQWEFELHNNGELIDTSEVTEQMFFKAYKGGTEEILPTNGSVPTTAPFLGDIRYPQGLLTDQEFTYRQSPTESDGLAKITDIKGNTLVWNQLIQNGNFADSSLWTGQFTTVSISNGVANVTLSVKGDYVALRRGSIESVAGHKYFITATFKSAKKTAVGFYLSGQYAYPTGYDVQAGTLTKVSAFINGGTDLGLNIYISRKNELEIGDVVEVSNVMLIDLTKMGLDSITDPSEFTSLFPLSYYSYNQGSLLSFNGNGIKTVGKNLFDLSQFASGPIKFIDDVLTGTGAQFHTAYGTYASAKKLNNPKGSQITISFDAWTDQNATSSGNGLIIATYHYDGTKEDAMIPNATGTPRHFTLQRQDIEKIGWSYGTQGANRWHITNFQVEFGTTETSYEPYTSSTLSLPISTYFPNGMNGHGDTYDELTSAVATKRFGKDSLGDLTWTRRTTNIFSANLPSMYDVSKGISCFTSNRLPTVFVSGYTLAEDGYISIYKIEATTSSTSIYLNMASQSIDTVADLKTWLSSNPTELVYPLATPTETSFTTASLVTENAEIPLSNEDGVLIGKCTEQLSENPGFIDAKIKLSDSDGTCYSNKIQLHVERSPQ